MQQQVELDRTGVPALSMHPTLPHVQASASFWQSLPHYLQGVNRNWILTMKKVSLIWRYFFRNLFASFSVPITKIMAGEQKLSRRWPSLWSQISSLRVAHCFGTVFLLRNHQSIYLFSPTGLVLTTKLYNWEKTTEMLCQEGTVN